MMDTLHTFDAFFFASGLLAGMSVWIVIPLFLIVLCVMPKYAWERVGGIVLVILAFWFFNGLDWLIDHVSKHPWWLLIWTVCIFVPPSLWEEEKKQTTSSN